MNPIERSAEFYLPSDELGAEWIREIKDWVKKKGIKVKLIDGVHIDADLLPSLIIREGVQILVQLHSLHELAEEHKSSVKEMLKELEVFNFEKQKHRSQIQGEVVHQIAFLAEQEKHMEGVPRSSEDFLAHLQSHKLKRNGQFFADQLSALFGPAVDPQEKRFKLLKYRITHDGDGCSRQGVLSDP